MRVRKGLSILIGAPFLLGVLLLCAAAYRTGRTTLRNLQGILEPELERQLGSDVTIGRAYLSGLGHIVLDNVAVANGRTFQEGTLLRARRATISVSLWDAVVRRQPVLSAIKGLRIQEPDVLLERQADGSLNLDKLMKAGGGGATMDQFRGRITLVDGRFTFRDHQAYGMPLPAETRLEGLSMGLDLRRAPTMGISLTARGGGEYLGNLNLAGKADTKSGDLNLRADFDGASVVHWQRYFAVAVRLPARSGVASGHVNFVSKDGGDLRVTGVVESPRVVIVPEELLQPLVATPLKARFDGNRIQLDAQGSIGALPLNLTGAIVARDSGSTMDLRLRLPRVVAAEAKKAIRDWPDLGDVQYDAPLSFEARIHGPVNAWQAAIAARIPSIHVLDTPITDGQATATYRVSADRLTVDSAKARVAGGNLQASGWVDLGADANLSFTGQANGVNLAKVPLLGDLRKQGVASVRFDAKGPLGHIVKKVSVNGRDLTLGPARVGSLSADVSVPSTGDPVVALRASGMRSTDSDTTWMPDRATATLDLLRGKVHVRQARAFVNGSPIDVSGNVSHSGTLDLRLAAQKARMQVLARSLGWDVAKDTQGTADVSARVTGTTEKPRVTGDVAVSRGKLQEVSFANLGAHFDIDEHFRGALAFNLADARVQGQKVPKASGQAALGGQEIKFSRITVDLPLGRLVASGSVKPDGKLDITLAADGVDLGAAVQTAGAGADLPLSGRGGFIGRVTGTTANPVLAGEVIAADGEMRGYTFTQLRGSINASRDGVTAQNIVLQRPGETLALDGTVVAGRGRPLALNGRVRTNSLDLAGALKAVGLDVNIAGKARADLAVTGAFPNMTIAGDFEVQNAVVDGIPVGRLSGHLERAGNHTRVTKLAAEDGNSRLVASGTLGPKNNLDLRIEGSQVDLARLAPFTGSYAQLAGRADLAGTIAGSLSNPQVRLDMRAQPIRINGQEFQSVTGAFSYAASELSAADVRVVGGGAEYHVPRLSFRPRNQQIDMQVATQGAHLEQLVALARGIKLPDTPTGRSIAAQIAALPSPLKGQFTGVTTISGRLPHPEGHAQFILENAAVGNARLQHLSGKATWSAAGIALREATVVSDGIDLTANLSRGEGDTLRLSARLVNSRLEALRALAHDASFLLPDMEAALRDLPEPFAGVISGEVNLSGRAKALDGMAHLTLSDARLGDARLKQAAVNARWDSGAIIVEDLVARSEGVDVSGSFARPATGEMQLDLQARNTDVSAARDLARAVAAFAGAYRRAPVLPESVSKMLADKSIPLAGRVDGSLKLSGLPGKMRGTINAQGTNVRYGDTQLTEVAATGNWSPQGWQFSRLSLTGTGYAVAGSLGIGPGDRVTADLTTENANLEAMRKAVAGATFLAKVPAGKKILDRVKALPAPFPGVVTAQARLSGTMANPDAQITFSGTNLVLGGQRVPQVVASVDMRDGIARIREMEARANGGSLRASGTLDLDGPIDLTLTGADFALAAFRPWIGGAQELFGHLDLAAKVTGTTRAPELRGSVVLRDTAVAGTKFERIEANALRVVDGRIDLGRVQLTSGTVTGFVEGYLPFRWQPLSIPADGPIQVRVAMPEHDLAAVAALIDGVESGTGKLSADLEIGGSLRDPKMGGSVAVRDGRIKLADLDTTFTGVQGRLLLQGSSIVVDSAQPLQANSESGGKVVVTGTLALRGGADRALDLRVHAEQLNLTAQNLAGVPGLRYSGLANGDLTLGGRIARPVLGGNVALSGVQLVVPAEIGQREATKLAFDPVLNIDVRVGDNSWVKRGRSMSAMVTGTANLRGRLNNPMVGGRAVVERGEMNYAGINFRLEPGGTISFNYDPPAPTSARLDVTALTRVRAVSPSTGDRRQYEVTLHVTGAMPNNVNVSVTSDPPDLPQNRLLGILARTDQFDAIARGENMDTVLRDQVADLVTGAVLPQVFEPIEDGIAQALGLDQVSFDYGFDQPLRVDARKEIMPRLYVSYNRDIGEGRFGTSTEEWSVTYRLYQRLFVGWRRESQSNKERLVLEGTFRF